MDFDLMPPPGSSNKKAFASMDVDQMIDPNEPTYCICHQVSLKLIYVHVPGTCICINIYIEHFSHMFAENMFLFLIDFQVSYGDMIACDNENVSFYGAIY